MSAHLRRLDDQRTSNLPAAKPPRLAKLPLGAVHCTSETVDPGLGLLALSKSVEISPDSQCVTTLFFTTAVPSSPDSLFEPHTLTPGQYHAIMSEHAQNADLSRLFYSYLPRSNNGSFPVMVLHHAGHKHDGA